MKQKISEDKIKSMMRKYCRPGNCEALAPVPVNLPVWKCIRKRTQQTDIMLQRNQGLICKGLIPTVTAIDTMLSKSMLTQEELLKSTQQLKDAFVFMQMAYTAMNDKRRQLIRNDLQPSYQSLCSEKNPVTTQLLGDDIDKKIKEVDSAHQLGSRIGKIKKDIGIGRGRSKRYEKPQLDTGIPMGLSGFNYQNFSMIYTTPLLPQVSRYNQGRKLAENVCQTTGLATSKTCQS